MQARNLPCRELPALDANQRYTIDEASAYLRQSRAKTYQDISSGALHSITDGRRRYVPGWAIAERSGAREVATA